MKKIKIITLLFVGTFFTSFIYSCVKESMANENGNGNGNGLEKANSMVQSLAAIDSSCNLCSEYKTVTVTPATFINVFNSPGIEMNSLAGRATISDGDIQANAKLHVTALDISGRETLLPLFTMAADGSYESLYYKLGSSYMMLFYTRYNKATNTFTYKPVNNLTVKYSVTKLN